MRTGKGERIGKRPCTDRQGKQITMLGDRARTEEMNHQETVHRQAEGTKSPGYETVRGRGYSVGERQGKYSAHARGGSVAQIHNIIQNHWLINPEYAIYFLVRWWKKLLRGGSQ